MDVVCTSAAVSANDGNVVLIASPRSLKVVSALEPGRRNGLVEWITNYRLIVGGRGRPIVCLRSEPAGGASQTARAEIQNCEVPVPIRAVPSSRQCDAVGEGTPERSAWTWWNRVCAERDALRLNPTGFEGKMPSDKIL